MDYITATLNVGLGNKNDALVPSIETDVYIRNDADVTLIIHAFQVEGVAQLDIEVGMCEQDAHIQEVVLRAVQRLGFADPRPQQMVAIKTFMQGKHAVFVSLPTEYGKSLIYSASASIRVGRIAWL